MCPASAPARSCALSDHSYSCSDFSLSPEFWDKKSGTKKGLDTILLKGHIGFRTLFNRLLHKLTYAEEMMEIKKAPQAVYGPSQHVIDMVVKTVIGILIGSENKQRTVEEKLKEIAAQEGVIDPGYTGITHVSAIEALLREASVSRKVVDFSVSQCLKKYDESMLVGVIGNDIFLQTACRLAHYGASPDLIDLVLARAASVGWRGVVENMAHMLLNRRPVSGEVYLLIKAYLNSECQNTEEETELLKLAEECMSPEDCVRIREELHASYNAFFNIV